MFEVILFLAGAASTYTGIAIRQRVPGEPWRETLVRPLGAGGPGPRR